MRKTLATLAFTALAMGGMTVGAGAASADTADLRIPPPCSDLPNAGTRPGGEVYVDITIVCFQTTVA